MIYYNSILREEMSFKTTDNYLVTVDHLWKLILLNNHFTSYDTNIADVVETCYKIMCRYFVSDLTESPLYFFDYDEKTNYQMLACAILKISSSLFGQLEDNTPFYPSNTKIEDKFAIEVYILTNFCDNLFSVKEVRQEWEELKENCKGGIISYYFDKIVKVFEESNNRIIDDENKTAIRKYLSHISNRLNAEFNATQIVIETAIFDF